MFQRCCPEGRPGISDVSPCLESQGCHLIPIYRLRSCFAAQSCYSVFFYVLAHSAELFVEYSSLRYRLFCMAHVYQLGEVSWPVVCTVWHWYLLLCNDTLKKNLVLINRLNGPRYQRFLALCAFLTREIPKGLILRKFCVLCFVIRKAVSGLILWCLGNLWFDDLCEE